MISPLEGAAIAPIRRLIDWAVIENEWKSCLDAAGEGHCSLASVSSLMKICRNILPFQTYFYGKEILA